ncbi:MAG: hypothetical protein D8H92_09690 [Campylobacter sp.]|nr:MAG: hypothetical protein D8H92_09690 [Campylobacter sp.]
MRNYDENPIIINDYGALFLAGWYIILYSILVFVFAFSDYKFYIVFILLLCPHFFYCSACTILIFSRREFLNKNRAFLDFLASKFII